MKLVKAIAILLLGPLFGVLVAFGVGALQLRSDPIIANNGGHAAPGDGILIMLYVFLSLIVSIPLSIAAVVRLLFRKSKMQDQTQAV